MTFEEQYLLAALVEECAEVQQNIMKAFRFGLSDINPNDPEKEMNSQRIDRELIDLEAVISMVREHVDAIPTESNTTLLCLKKVKVGKWLKYARDKDENYIQGYEMGAGT